MSEKTILECLQGIQIDEKRRVEARTNAYKKQMRELAQFDNNMEVQEGEKQVIAADEPDPIMDLIERDVFNVVPVGSKAYC